MTQTHPNIILVTVDCFRYDRCGFNGYSRSTTPFLDSLATESYLFDNAFATGPYTPESFPGILAGLHSKEELYTQDLRCKAISPDSTTVASHLTDHGYTSVATITNPHLSANRNFDIGFEEFQNLRINKSGTKEENDREDSSKLGMVRTKVERSLRRRMRNQDRYPHPLLPLLVLQRHALLSDWPTIDADVVRDTFIKQLKQVRSVDSSPLFGWTHLMDLHTPLHPEKYRTRDGESITSWWGYSKRFAADGARMSDIYHPRYDDMYDGIVRYIDAQIESLVESLQHKGLWKDTVLIVTGDHGEATGERGLYEHPWHYLFDEVLRVPLLVRIPGETGTRVKAPFSLGWLHELISEAIGIEPASMPATTDTQRHLNSPPTDRTVLSDSVSKHGYSAAVRDSEYKYISHRGDSLPDYVFELTGEQAAYRIDCDRGETAPISLTNIPDRLQARFNDYHVHPDDVTSLHQTLGQEANNRLEQLGYLSQ